MADFAELTKLIETEAKAQGLSLVRVKMMGGTSDPTLQVMAERPETRQLTLEDCARLSRRLSEMFDELDPIEHAYRLEVSSPGIDRPLTRLQDFEDWKGHEAKIVLEEKLDGRKQFTGVLGGIEGENIVMDVEGLGEARLPFSMLHSAKLLMTEKLIQATAPLSAEGADTIEEDTAASGDGSAEISKKIEVEGQE
ncbi:MAG TPA: ribosome maturation protein RimP, partial [Allosphingosinicella sp.]|jgi:ribosome maturation factor RimP